MGSSGNVNYEWEVVNTLEHVLDGKCQNNNYKKETHGFKGMTQVDN